MTDDLKLSDQLQAQIKRESRKMFKIGVICITGMIVAVALFIVYFTPIGG
jgi:hypothetical protein